MLIATFAALAIAATTPASATAPAAGAPMSPPAAAAATSRTDPNQRVCVVQRITGSMIPLRHCKTLADWQAAGVDPFAKD